MHTIESLSAPEEQKRLLRLAAERYKRAVGLRFEAARREDSFAFGAASGEFRDALRALLALGYPLDAVQPLYNEALAALEGG
jgi:hypothetical protein